MADEKKSTYPSISKKNWFALRKQFIRSVPSVAGPSYVKNVLDMSTEDSARANVVNGLKLVGLIDKDNKPTKLALRWRDDSQYKDVCEEIRQNAYPDELKEIAPDLETPIDRVEKWFVSTGEGISAAQKHAAFYRLLQEGDPAKESENARPSTGSRSSARSRTSKVEAKQNINQTTVAQEGLASDVPSSENKGDAPSDKKSRPSLHIDIQIHISPESSADQIEQIFASMAKHLKDI